MIIINVYEGFVSEIRAFFLAYRLSRVHNDKMILDLSQFYRGSFWSYHMDLLCIPNVDKIAFRDYDSVKCLEREYGKIVTIIRDGIQLEEIHKRYNNEEIYYLINDSYIYDDFFVLHREYYFRHIGSDNITKELFSMIKLKKPSKQYIELRNTISDLTCTSVGVHIRLGDFYNVGWIVEKDFDFYKAAIQWFRENKDEVKFFIFSDDLRGARDILGEYDDLEYVQFDFSYQSDIEELFCLASCDCRVLDKKSTYGLFAETIAQNQYNTNGLTAIIKERHFQNDAGNKDYVEKATNTDEGVNKREYFGIYKEFDENEIERYSNRYIHDNTSTNTYREAYTVCVCDSVVFATRQTYVKAFPHGLQYLAHYLAKHNYNVGFIGKRMDIDGAEQSTALTTVFNNICIESGMNSLVSDVKVIDYKLLNELRLYNDFYKIWKEKYKVSTLKVIVRKPIALPPMEKHGDDVFIFIDFSDPFDYESLCCRKEYKLSDIEYLYENADFIITFDKTIEQKWSKTKAIRYIDLGQVYPYTFRTLGGDISYQLRRGMENYSKEIQTIIENI